MIAIDTNIFVYAHRAGVPEHRAAQAAIEAACNANEGWGVTLPSVAEFFSIVTHPAATGRPSTAEEAAAFFRMLEVAGGLVTFTPGAQFGTRLLQTAADLSVTGVRIFDLQIGLCALDGGATQLWTHDHNFVKIPGLRMHDPLT